MAGPYSINAVRKERNVSVNVNVSLRNNAHFVSASCGPKLFQLQDV